MINHIRFTEEVYELITVNAAGDYQEISSASTSVYSDVLYDHINKACYTVKGGKVNVVQGSNGPMLFLIPRVDLVEFNPGIFEVCFAKFVARRGEIISRGRSSSGILDLGNKNKPALISYKCVGVKLHYIADGTDDAGPATIEFFAENSGIPVKTQVIDPAGIYKLSLDGGGKKINRVRFKIYGSPTYLSHIVIGDNATDFREVFDSI